nr:hypothetical protein Itr_chr05CG07190 [Ipomoea trifida]
MAATSIYLGRGGGKAATSSDCRRFGRRRLPLLYSSATLIEEATCFLLCYRQPGQGPLLRPN